jgi:hypothetical protein
VHCVVKVLERAPRVAPVRHLGSEQCSHLFDEGTELIYVPGRVAFAASATVVQSVPLSTRRRATDGRRLEAGTTGAKRGARTARRARASGRARTNWTARAPRASRQTGTKGTRWSPRSATAE